MLGNRLEFSQFGHFNYFSVYRSLTPMNPTNLPTPIATGLTTMYYFDSDVLDVLDRNLYYRVLVHRDDEVLVSDEVKIYINSFSEPQHLTVIFDHTNLELILAWDVEGEPTEQRYYCSETPFTAETKSVAKAVLANDVRTYVDTSVEAGKTYYVAVGSVKNGVEKLSEIVVKSTNIGFLQYRVYITTNNSSFYLSINEIEMFTAGSNIDETNPILAQTAASASQYSTIDDSRPHKAFDNLFGLKDNWVVGTNYGSVIPVSYPAWISYNFNEIKNIERMKIYPQPRSDLVDRAPRDFIVQGSNDGVTWTDIKSFSNVTDWIAGTGKTFNLVTGSIT